VLLEDEVEGIGELLLEHHAALDVQLVGFPGDRRCSNDVFLRVESPADRGLRAYRDRRAYQMEAGRSLRHQPESVRGELHRLAVAIGGGVFDSKKHDKWMGWWKRVCPT
jgi:hypothetical protein